MLQKNFNFSRSKQAEADCKFAMAQKATPSYDANAMPHLPYPLAVLHSSSEQ
jgi:hypothetical protein